MPATATALPASSHSQHPSNQHATDTVSSDTTCRARLFNPKAAKSAAVMSVVSGR